AERVVADRGLRVSESEFGDAVEAARLDPVDRASRRPGAFVVAAGDLAVRTDAHAVRGAKAAGHDFELRAVLGHLEQAAVVRHDLVPAASAGPHGTAAHKVKVAVGIGL